MTERGESGWSADSYVHSGRGRWGRPGGLFNRGPVRMGLSALGAVVLGLIFGYAVLSVFQEEQFYQTYRTVLDGTVQTLTAPAGSMTTEKAEGADASGSEAAAGETLVLPELRLYVVQAGVFSSEEAARPVIDALTREGFPHWRYDADGKMHVMVGAAPSRDDILGIASALTRKQMEVYVKELGFPGKELAAPSPFGTDADGSPPANRVGAFAASGTEMVEALSAWSGQVLAGSRPDAGAAAAETNRVKQLHLRFLEESRAVESAAPEAWKPFIAGMVSGLNRAVTALEEAREANLESHAWQVQAGVAAYLEHYAKWLAQAVR